MSFLITGAALVVGGTAVGLYNQNQAANKQDAALAAGYRQQGQLQGQANQATQKLISQYQNSSAKPYQQQAVGQFLQAVNANAGDATQPLNQVGATSDAYKQAAKNAALGISTYGKTNANLMGAMDAPQMQRQALTGDQLAYGSQVGNIEQQSRTAQFLAQLKAQSIQPNPWLTGLSGLMTSFGGAAASGAALRGLNSVGSASAAGSGAGSTLTGSDGLTYNLPFATA
jgi:hypothetical protein